MPLGSGDGRRTQLVSGLNIPAQWWRIFHSAELDALVGEALKNSPTLEAAKQALRAAQEQVKAQQGAFYPSVSASLQPSHQAFAETLSSPLQSGNSIYNLTTTQVSVSYTPDLFGANRRAVESLVAQADQQRFELEAARLTLASNVVLAAIQDASLRAQIDETQAIIQEQRQTLASFRRQFQLGQVSKADLAAQEALVAQSQAALPPLEKAFRINRDLLSALMGRTPGEPLDVRFDLLSLTLPEQLPLSLPAQLVEHRPDVRIAEAELHAASAQVGMAVAARWPNLQIEANAGSAALGLVPSFSSAANFWNVAATLTQPVFQGGTLLHRQRAAEAAYREAAAQYRATVVGAFQNTADVLHALWTDADALRADQVAETASRKSLDIARRQLGLGDVSPLMVLNAEESDHQAQLTLLQARASRYADVAALFQALGGGWWSSDTSASRPAGGS
jgi:NodT family efflux transporter outer membrane factor (OMF) lipoprotein